MSPTSEMFRYCESHGLKRLYEKALSIMGLELNRRVSSMACIMYFFEFALLL